MANITFSSPSMARDVTVYAVAGDRGTILAIAKANKIPIPFDCQDGECGSCLIEVKHLDPLAKHCIALTEKEKEMLKQLGKITKAEIADAEVNDMPPRHRLACQCFVRHEDVHVAFEGDKALPAAAPAATPAARRYKGGMVIASVPDFMGYAAAVEADAALHFDDLAKAMSASKAGEIAKLFGQLADQSRKQAGEAKAQAGGADVAKEVPDDYVWPHYATPESDALWAGDASLSRLDALKAALMGERRCYEFYCAAEATAKSPEVAKAARPFIKAEGERVKVLEAWITREDWSAKH
jgi:ferredoxin/rubrerythrin